MVIKMLENLGDWAVHFGVYILDETAQGKIENDNNFVDMLEGGDWRLPLDYHILKPPRSLRPSPIDFATLWIEADILSKALLDSAFAAAVN